MATSHSAMKRLALALLLCSALVAPAVTIDRTWLEGDDALRGRLEGLQDKAAPDLMTKKWLNSKPLSFIGLAGKVVVVDFWAAWSKDCRSAIPTHNRIYETYRKQGLIWIGVCSTQGGEDFEKTVQELDIKYPVCLDESGFSDMRFAVDGYPDYYVISRHGKIVAADAANDRIEDIVKLLLAEPYP
jgi:cytochrome c biogenesis protein CcmG/thiol:disulfide interchange protein DsbE